MTEPTEQPSRRDFVAASGSALGGAWLARFVPLLASLHACASEAARSRASFVTLTPREGADFEALASRIVPTDETPGATEAGVVHFADRALGDLLSDLLPVVREGLAALNARVAAAHSGVATFADLEAPLRDAMVAETERGDPDFFFCTRMLVVLGLVTNPEYGGNQSQAGWRLIGFEGTFGYQPPFGYYDRDEHGPATGGAAR